MNMDKINKFLFALLTILLVSCEKNVLYELEDGRIKDALNTDTFQESKRSYSDEEVSYKFTDDVKFFSEKQTFCIKNVVDSILYFSNDIESNQLPKVGDIYAQNFVSTLFPQAFVGRVLSVSTEGDCYKVVTTEVPLDSVFSELKIDKTIDVSDYDIYDAEGNIISSSTIVDEDDDSDFLYVDTESSEVYSEMAKTRAHVYAPLKTKLRYTAQRKEWNAKFMNFPNIKSEGQISVGGYVDVNVDMLKDYMSLEASLKGEIKASTYAQVESKIGFDQTNKLVGVIYARCPSVPLVSIPLSFYSYTTCDANIKLSADINVKISPSLKLEIKDNIFSGKASIGSKNKFFNTKSKFSVSGKLGYGMGIRAFIGIGLGNWSKRMESAYVDGRAEFTSNSNLDIANSSDGMPGNLTYQALSNAEFKITAGGGFYAEKKGILRFFGKRINEGKDSYQYLSKKTIDFTIATLYLLPKVSAWSKDLGTNSANITYVLSRMLLLPVSYGMALYQGDNKLQEVYADKKYWLTSEQQTFTFSSLGGGSYQVYPIYKLLGVGPEIKSTEMYNFDMKEIDLCPDGNHPHLIDLGLSSGTKWACCNIGAKSPNEYGGLYCFADPTGELTTIGSDSRDRNWPEDISGSSYDIAHVKWGNGWCLPRSSEARELYYNDNFHWTWTTYKGTPGYKITGPNGNSIFLPAAGSRWARHDWGKDVFMGKDEDCSYWLSNYTSEDRGEDGGGIWHFGDFFNRSKPNASENSWSIQGVSGWAGTGIGLSVRPVKRNIGTNSSKAKRLMSKNKVIYNSPGANEIKNRSSKIFVGK